MAAKSQNDKQPVSLDELLNAVIEINGATRVDIGFEGTRAQVQVYVDGVWYPLFRAGDQKKVADHVRGLVQELEGRAVCYQQHGVPVVAHTYNGALASFEGVRQEFHLVESDTKGVRIFVREEPQG